MLKLDNITRDRCFLDFRWGNGEEITFFNRERDERKQQDNNSAFALLKENNSMGTINIGDKYDLKQLRELLVSFHDIFVKLQEDIILARDNLSAKHNSLERASASYKDALDKCVKNLEEDNQLYLLQNDDLEDSPLSSVIEIIVLGYNIWTLCEVLFLKGSHSFVSFALQQWIFKHMHTPTAKETLLLLYPSKSQEYWFRILNSTMVGDFELLSFFLSKHASDYAKEGNEELSILFEDVLELIETYPLSNSDFTLRVPELVISQLNSWTNNVDSVHTRVHSHPASPAGLKDLVNILIGDDNTSINYCDNSWSALLASSMLYKYPNASTNEVGIIASNCMKVTNQSNDPWCMRFRKILNGDPHVALSVLKGHAGDGDDLNFPTLLATHLADFLTHCNAIDNDISLEKDGRLGEIHGGVREVFICELAAGLMNTKGMWSLACSYLEYTTYISPKTSKVYPLNSVICGRDLMAETISRISLTNDTILYKVLDIVNKYGIDEEKSSLCKTRAMNWKKSGKHKNAVMWLTMGGDLESVSKLNNSLIEKAVQSASLANLDSLITSFDGLGDGYEFLPLYKELSSLLLDIPIIQDVLKLSDEKIKLKDHFVFNEDHVFNSHKGISNHSSLKKASAASPESQTTTLKKEILRMLEVLQHEACIIIEKLICKQVAPKKLWIPILSKFQYLLNNRDRPCVSSSLSINIIKSIYDLTMNHRFKDYVKDENVIKQIAVLRSSLSQNISHCIIKN